MQKKGRPLHLTPKALLHNLMMNAGRTVPHDSYFELRGDNGTDVLARVFADLRQAIAQE